MSIAAIGASTAAFAQSSTGPRPVNSFSVGAPGSSYIGLNAGQSKYSLGNGTGLYNFDKKDSAYGINAGTYLNDYVGVELGYTNFGNAQRGGGETEAQGVNLSLIGRLPVSQSFNLLGKLGTTYSRTEVSSLPGSGITAGKEDGFGLSYGVGAEYAFTPSLSAVLQYDQHRMKFAGDNKDDVSATTVGLRYRF